jgi:DNA-binding MarR family transcriptional regulator
MISISDQLETLEYGANMTTNVRARRTFRGRDAEFPAHGAAVEAPASRVIDLGPLPYHVGYMMRRAWLAWFQDFLRTFADVAIRPAQYGVLMIIELNPGLKQADVSAALGIKRTNLVALLDGLEERGFARREAAAGDRRSYALYLTSKGTALLQRLRELDALHESRMIARIGEDGRMQLLSLLAAVREAFGPSQLEQDKET